MKCICLVVCTQDMFLSGLEPHISIWSASWWPSQCLYLRQFRAVTSHVLGQGALGMQMHGSSSTVSWE